MAHVSRPQKTEGNRTYVEEVDAGQPDIIDFELDEDFRVIYDEFNGGIDDTNIAPGAAIDYSKLDLQGRIQGSDIDPTTTLPITIFPPGGPTTGIPGTSIQDHTIGPTQLWAPRGDHSGTPGSASPAPFVNEVGNLALFASQQGTPQSHDDTSTITLTPGTPGPETLLGEVAWTSRAGPFFVNVSLLVEVLAVDTAAPITGTNITMRLRGPDGVTPGTISGGVYVERTSRIQGDGIYRTPVTFSGLYYGSTVLSSGVGPKHFQLTVFTDTNTVITQVRSSHLMVFELA